MVEAEEVDEGLIVVGGVGNSFDGTRDKLVGLDAGIDDVSVGKGVIDEEADECGLSIGLDIEGIRTDLAYRK